MTQTTIIAEVTAERNKQNAKWGFPQPAMRSPQHALSVLGEEFGEIARAVVEMDVCKRVVDQISEPFHKAMEMDDFKLNRKNLRDELIQTAAVAIAWIEQMEYEDKGEQNG